jgi:hypothetical protein
MAKRVEVVIDDTGDVKIEAFGYTGQQCTQATADLEEALGGPVKRRFKPEARGQVQQKRTVDQSA